MNETRAEKAQRLVDKRQVTITRHGRFFDDAQVSCGHHTYFVTLYSNAPYVCSCGWGLFRTPGHDPCIHAEAVERIIEKSR